VGPQIANRKIICALWAISYLRFGLSSGAAKIDRCVPPLPAPSLPAAGDALSGGLFAIWAIWAIGASYMGSFPGNAARGARRGRDGPSAARPHTM